MKVILHDVGKRFNLEWVFRHLNFTFEPAGRYAITGPNGSGKSTLLQVIGGYLHHNQGHIEYFCHDQKITEERLYRCVSLAAPYLEVIEELTLYEFLSFHHKMKGLVSGFSIAQIAADVSLKNALHKQIRYYSSGMKQRVKLAQAFFSETPLLLLDEPLTNLDEEGVDVFNRLVQTRSDNRTIIISSNDKREYQFCDHIISVSDFKENDN